MNVVVTVIFYYCFFFFIDVTYHDNKGFKLRNETCTNSIQNG